MHYKKNRWLFQQLHEKSYLTDMSPFSPLKRERREAKKENNHSFLIKKPLAGKTSVSFQPLSSALL